MCEGFRTRSRPVMPTWRSRRGSCSSDCSATESSRLGSNFMNLAAPLIAVIVAPDGEIAAGGSDGHVHFLSHDGHARSALAISAAPITSLAMARDGDRIAAASADGSLAIIDRRSRSILRGARGSGAPIWAVVFLPDTRTLLSGGADRAIHRWDAETLKPQDSAANRTAEDPLEAYTGDP